MKITKKRVDRLKPPSTGNKVYWDEDLRGFGLRVTAKGAKSYVLNYRINGRERRYTIGQHGELTPTQARADALSIKAEIRQGVDPLAERGRLKVEKTFADLCDEYQQTYMLRKKSAASDKQYISFLLPKLKNRKLSEIKRRDIEVIHQKKGSEAPYAANRMLALLSRMFSLAVSWGWATDNPARGIQKFKETSRDRFVKTHELPRLLEAINAYPEQFVKAALWLCFLTGARKGEVLSARWDDFDFDMAQWRLPDSKGGRPHVIPLSGPAIKLLRTIPKVDSNPYVFAGRRKGAHLKNIDKAWRTIRKNAKLSDVRIHDIRRTLGSYMALQGDSLPLIGKVLNHRNPTTTSIYARLEDDAPRAALETVGESLMLAANNRVDSAVYLPKEG
jgi:integrase